MSQAPMPCFLGLSDHKCGHFLAAVILRHYILSPCKIQQRPDKPRKQGTGARKMDAYVVRMKRPTEVAHAPPEVTPMAPSLEPPKPHAPKPSPASPRDELKAQSKRKLAEFDATSHKKRGPPKGIPSKPPWKQRYAEFRAHASSRSVKVLHTEQEWRAQCASAKWCPKLHCTVCDYTVATTTIVSFMSKGSMACMCSGRVGWCERYAEVCAHAASRDIEVLHTEEEWIAQCKNQNWCPQLHCNACDYTVTATSVSNFMHRGAMGCMCSGRVEWRKRYAEFCAHAASQDVEVLHTEEEWIAQCKNHKWCPQLRCKVCDYTVATTSVKHFITGLTLGCACNRMAPWRERYAEVCAHAASRDVEVLHTEEEWIAQCKNQNWCPQLHCKVCDYTVATTSILGFMNQGAMGCMCSGRVRWSERYAEVCAHAASRDVEVLHTEEEWIAQCLGGVWCPNLRCKVCDYTVSTTSTSNFMKLHRLGCMCFNKTEAKLLVWLRHASRLPDVRNNMLRGCTNPSTGYALPFDFDSPSVKLIIELDGFQHFIDRDVAKRDLIKEQWAQCNGYQIVRVLQEDVWHDKNGWENYLMAEITRWRNRCASGLRAETARHPYTPEYLGGIYAELRMQSSNIPP